MYRVLPVLLCLPLLGASTGDTLRSLSRRFNEGGGAAAREALTRFAAEHHESPEGALGYLVLGIADYQEKRKGTLRRLVADLMGYDALPTMDVG